MSPRPARARRTLAALVLVATTVSGCASVERSVVGIHDAPTEEAEGAPMSRAEASSTARTALDAAAAAPRGRTAADGRERRDVLTGPALLAADAAAAVRADGAKVAAPEKVEDPTVLAVSSGARWPRAILATSRSDRRQKLHVLVSDSPDAPFRLHSSVTMEPGASVPSLGAFEDGAELVTSTDRGDGSPLAVGDRFARAWRFPAASKGARGVSTADAFSTARRQNAERIARKNKGLATYEQTHRSLPGTAIGFRLADGGVLGITSLERIDRFSLNAKARGFVLPSDLRALLETSVVKEGFRTRTIETIAFTTRGTPTLVGASEQLRSASAS